MLELEEKNLLSVNIPVMIKEIFLDNSGTGVEHFKFSQATELWGLKMPKLQLNGGCPARPEDHNHLQGQPEL